MSSEALDLLVVLADGGAASAIAAALRRRGHAVWVVEDADQAELPASASTVLCELGALERLRERGCKMRAVVLDLPDDPQAWRRALQLGAADALGRPWRIAELIAAVEIEPAAATSKGCALRRSVAAEADAIDAALVELCSFLALHRIAPSARARALTATAELLENCVRHAYPPPPARGSIELEVHVRQRELEIAVSDRGRGFEPSAALEGGGLARAAVLAEDLRIESNRGQGTRAALRFSALRVEFDDGANVDLSDLDWLSPALARRVLASLGDGQAEPFYSFSPALAVTVGRLLAGATERQRIERALWSNTGSSTGSKTA